MSRKVIVSIVSDQTIPNVLFIQENSGADFYYFISTQKMEMKNSSLNICKAAGIEAPFFSIIEVQEDSLLDIEDTLQDNFSYEDDDKILVNITGGTKIMSLGVYNFFARHGAAEIYYLPIGKNEIAQTFPLRKNKTKALGYRINLFDYLTANGVNVSSKFFSGKNSLTKNEDIANAIFNHFLGNHRSRILEITEMIRTSFRGKKIIPTKSELDYAAFYSSLELINYGMEFEKDDQITSEETKYLTGDWFEEYVYTKVKTILNIPDDHIGIGVQLNKDGNQNEYDIIFTLNNALYVIECKTDVSDQIEGEEARISYLFTNTLYKAATLKKEFGLWVNYYLFALNDFSNLTEQQRKRAEQLDIKLAGTEILGNIESLTQYIKKMN